MGYSISMDWQKVMAYGKWENMGRDLLVKNCTHKTQSKCRNTNAEYSGYCEECEISEDSGVPMMNYAYPLDHKPEDEDILAVVKKTNCTVMCNSDTDEYFIALTGGGMDLSQDIALAYVILEKWIPEGLIINVCSQKELSIHSKDFKILKEAIIEQAKHYKNSFVELGKKWSSIK